MLYTNGAEVISMKFNARGTTNVDWFTQNNLLQSPWTDLKSAANIFPFRINGHHGARNFEISAKYAGCPNDVGWFIIGGSYCAWEKFHPVPAILYSKKTHNIKWNNAQGRNCIKKSWNTSVTVFVCFFFFCYQIREITRYFLNRPRGMASLPFIYSLFFLLK